MSTVPSISKHLSQVFPESLHIVNGFDPLIQGMSLDSREIKENYLFVAKQGYQLDGRDFIEDAISKGASAVLSEVRDNEQDKQNDSGFSLHKSGCPIYFYKNIDQVLGEISKRFFSYPSDEMKVIGVTGTNGKSSICHFIAQALSLSGYKVAVMGTLGNGFLGQLQASGLTTVDAINVHKSLATFFQQGADYVCMEVSSHSLDQGRVNGVEFDVAVFSNLSRDHLDYHLDMESYAAAKEKLFHFSKLRSAVIKLDETGKQFAKNISSEIKTITVANHEKADLCIIAQKVDASGLYVEFSFVENTYCIRNLHLLGEFNVDNLLLAFATLVHVGVEADKACKFLEQVQPVSGRMQKVSNNFIESPLVVVDYAHTPDALEKALISMELIKPKRLSLVFGCGGDRDQGKRSLMARVAGKYCDQIIVTSDNPRSEHQEKIIADILSGFSELQRKKVIVENDRKKAIEYALSNSGTQDAVLVAGKGHENFQIIGKQKFEFNDVAVCKDALEKKFSGYSAGRRL